MYKRQTGESVGTVTLSIHCENAAAHREQLLEKGEDATIVPEDGIILAATTIDIFPDESACDILDVYKRQEIKRKHIHKEHLETYLLRKAIGLHRLGTREALHLRPILLRLNWQKGQDLLHCCLLYTSRCV